MWIVRLALRRPYTFVVAAMLVAILGIVTLLDMPTDIFPDIDIPVISVIFNYPGMPADDMEKRIVSNFERFLTTTVSDIEHIESQSLTGVAVIKIFFQKNAKIEAATAQVTAVSQTAIRVMPPGTQPPLVIRYSASSVPILQLALSSDTMSEQQIFDAAINVLRPQLIVIPGLQTPYPYGGKQRQIMVDLDPQKLFAFGISASDVSNAINAQNLILPAGTAKIGRQEYPVRLNSSPGVATELNDLPIKTVNGSTVYIRDVASVRDGFSVQTNVVNIAGKRGILISILKSGNASTLEVVDSVKKALPAMTATLPREIKVEPLFDQSLFVRAAVEGVIKEAGIAAGLTALMILLFLGSWRSTLIVVISIPLSILVAIIVLNFLGESLNVMTLGGMALAVGILVDDATVEIENIHRNLHQRKRLVKAILDGAQQIAVPAFVSTLCICIVFVPVVFISGAARYLFTPLAMSVVFSMLTSYLLSRTLVPTMVHYLLAAEVERYGGQLDPNDPHAAGAICSKQPHDPEDLSNYPEATPREENVFRSAPVRILLLMTAMVIGVGFWRLAPMHLWFNAARDWCGENRTAFAYGVIVIFAALLLVWFINHFDLLWRVHDAFNRQFEKLRTWYGSVLAWALEHGASVTFAFCILVIGSCSLLLLIGRDFFPAVDAGQFRLHVRAPAGTRIEETGRYFARVEDLIREVIPNDKIVTMLDNIGIPNSGINLSLSDGTLMSPADGEILVALSKDHEPTAVYIEKLRRELAKRFPDLICFFQPPDIATQVLNFGLSASIDVQIAGRNSEANLNLARRMMTDIRKIPGAADVHLQQVVGTPDLRIAVDRVLASQVGATQRDVASDLLISLSSSGQTAPNFWLSPVNGVNYSVLVQTPQNDMDSLEDLQNTPVITAAAGKTNLLDRVQLLGNLATFGRGYSQTNITHFNILPTVDVQMSISGTDLGHVAGQVQKVLDAYRSQLPRGSTFILRGQVESMNRSFEGMSYGLIFAVLLVYLLMVINFQSWLDPLIILMALPGALAGIVWMLFITGTTINVPALMGAIMSIGVATSNSILMITFANDQRELGLNAHDAALAAGITRLRPVVMTALAMIIGMLPMSLGLGEGGEQNAPLGRAVIGGLLMATFATLLFVPVMYSVLRRSARVTLVEEELK